ncbi:hypothetical protein HKX48_005530 [Thoreauomyces humboldtii]|nr:hypothetical protein HKX48_005530 [Thoreauomyces humboldtii]
MKYWPIYNGKVMTPYVDIAFIKDRTLHLLKFRTEIQIDNQRTALIAEFCASKQVDGGLTTSYDTVRVLMVSCGVMQANKEDPRFRALPPHLRTHVIGLDDLTNLLENSESKETPQCTRLVSHVDTILVDAVQQALRTTPTPATTGCLNSRTPEDAPTCSSSAAASPTTLHQIPTAQASRTHKKPRLSPLISWLGGKSEEIRHFQEYIPSLRKHENYVEPFAGGLAVMNHVGHTRNAISDTHLDLLNFYSEIKHGHGESIYTRMSACKFDEAEFKNIRDERYDQPEHPTNRAFRFYYLRATSFRGMVRYKTDKAGGITSGGGFGNRRDVRYKELLERTEIIASSYEAVLARHDTPRSFVFLDPPYDCTFTNYGFSTFGREDHMRLAHRFKTTKARCLLILGKTSFVSQLYKGYIRKEFSKNYRFNIAGTPTAPEFVNTHLVITNY